MHESLVVYCEDAQKWAKAAHFGARQSQDFVQGSTKRLAVSAGRIWDFYSNI